MSKPIENNLDLLNKMVSDMKSKPEACGVGPYWRDSSEATIKALRIYGLRNFRETKRSHPGHVMSDAPCLGIYDYSYPFSRSPLGRLKERIYDSWFIRHHGLDMIDKTVRMKTKRWLFERLRLFRDYWAIQACGEWFLDVTSQFTLPNTCAHGCLDFVTLEGQKISISYLGTLSRVANLLDHHDLSGIKRLLLIGGGFGYEAHLIMHLFPKIQTCISVDIPPYLYIQTQYLRSMVEMRVVDYAQVEGMQRDISIDEMNRTIYVVAPWQLDGFKVQVDLLWNSCSFQEMTLDQVKFYATAAAKMMTPSIVHNSPSICLVMYDDGPAPLSQDQVLKIFDLHDFTSYVSTRPFYEPGYNETLFLGMYR